MQDVTNLLIAAWSRKSETGTLLSAQVFCKTTLKIKIYYKAHTQNVNKKNKHNPKMPKSWLSFGDNDALG